METQPELLKSARTLIENAQRILLVAHRRPDGDTLGACVGLYVALKQLGKKPVMACIDEIPKRMRFIPETDKFVREFSLNEYDLIIISDAGAYHMTGFHERYPDFLSKKVPILNLDHHFSNEGFGSVNIIDPQASCATMIVWRLLKTLPVTFTPPMAMALLAGVYNDTGGFLHANTTLETFQMGSELTAVGVKVIDIVKPLFKDSSLSQLRLWGYILEHMNTNEEGVLSSVVTEGDFKMIGAHSGDTGGIIDVMSRVPNVSFAMLLAEDEGWIKGSLRTQRDDVNVSDIAGQFGGGGHKKAAGFRMQGHLKKQTVWKIIPATAVGEAS